jgi:hypothetical protein
MGPWRLGYRAVFLLFLFLSLCITQAYAVDQPCMGWGGHFEGGKREFDKYLTLMKSDGWTGIRVYGWIPWLHDGEIDPPLDVLDYAVKRAAELGITVIYDPLHNYPPSDYLQGHLGEAIEILTMIGLRYNNRSNLVLEVVNEWQPESAQEGYDTFQAIITALRGAGVRLPLLVNYHASWMLDFSHGLDDPLNNLIYGNHYYGNAWDDETGDGKSPLNLTAFADEIGVTEYLDRLFTTGDIGQVLSRGGRFAVTELGASYHHSDTWVPGGYDMDPGGVCFVLKFLEYAAKYKVTVIAHRVGDSYQCDYQAYVSLSRSYFGEALDNPIRTGLTMPANPLIGGVVILFLILLVVGLAVVLL